MPGFLLHPGLGLSIVPYWEHWPEVETATLGDAPAVRAGTIRKGVVTASPPLPMAWMAGRFFAHQQDRELIEITAQVQVDLEKGLAACPEWLRTDYRLIATRHTPGDPLTIALLSQFLWQRMVTHRKELYAAKQHGIGALDVFKTILNDAVHDFSRGDRPRSTYEISQEEANDGPDSEAAVEPAIAHW